MHAVNPSVLLLLLRSLLEQGYTLLHVRDELAGSPLLGRDYLGALPELEEIVAENLQHDVDDAHQVLLLLRALC
jgi:hypothetical protein